MKPNQLLVMIKRRTYLVGALLRFKLVDLKWQLMNNLLSASVSLLIAEKMPIYCNPILCNAGK